MKTTRGKNHAHISDKVLLILAGLVSMYFLFANPLRVGSQGQGDCESGYIYKDESSPFGYSGAQIITKVIVKAGSDQSTDGNQCTVFTSDGSNGCYLVTGLGTTNVSVTKIGSGKDCKDISHVEFYSDPASSPTPTQTPTSTPTPTNTPTNTPTPTSTPTSTNTPTPTSTVKPTRTVTPTPTNTVTPTPTSGQGGPDSTPTPTDAPTATPTTGTTTTSTPTPTPTTSSSSNDSGSSDSGIGGPSGSTLGTSTLAETGTGENLAVILVVMGLFFSLGGTYGYIKNR